MKTIFSSLPAMAIVLFCSGCGETNQSASDATGKKQKNSNHSPAANTTIVPPIASTDDPAIGVLETGDVRFKLHGLLEFIPQEQPGFPVDENKKYIMADMSVENIGTAPIYPASYMLTAQLIDQKGRKHSFVSSIKTVALFDGHPSNKYSPEQSAGFTSESFAPGKKARGFLYGFEVDKDVVFTKMTMRTNDTLITAVLKQ